MFWFNTIKPTRQFKRKIDSLDAFKLVTVH